MEKIRVNELARKLGLTSKEVLERLRSQGVEVKSNLSSVDAALERLFKAPAAAAASPAPAVSKPSARPAAAPAGPSAARPALRTPSAPAARPPAPPPAARPPAQPSPAGSSPAKPPVAATPAGSAARTGTSQPAQPSRQAPPSRPAPPARPAGPAARPGGPVPSAPRVGPPPHAGGMGGHRPGQGGRPGSGAHSAHRRPSSRPAIPEPKPVAAPAPPPGPPRPIAISEGVTVRELAEKMNVKVNDVLKRLLMRGIMSNVNRPMDQEMARQVALEFGFEVSVVTFEEDAALEEKETHKGGERLPRSPVVTVMGHVDHGKTSLLDAIRETRVVDREHGGITQHIGAYTVSFKSRGITFLDTPGHEAFTLMRARGAKVTDIVVLVVAADDGVMPQTVEAIDHARAAGVPIIAAINKMDKPDAKPDVVKKQLSDRGLLVEDWGGDVVSVHISAKQKTGLDDLLEMILLVADLQDLKADPKLPGTGTVLEARLDRSRGPVATVLVQNGTLKVGDAFIAGAVSGKVRAMLDDAGAKVMEAGPSRPVEVLGLQAVPMAGDVIKVITEEWKARQIGAYRQQKQREEMLQKTSRLTLDHLYQKIQEGSVKELSLVVKADVQGSVEALVKILSDLTSPKVKVKVVHASTGAITESDVLLAAATNSIVIGFNVRPDPKASDLADQEEVELRMHTVIYDVANEIKAAMAGMLEPTLQEVALGRAEVRNTFKVPRYGIVAGCLVTEGRIVRNADVRLLRDNVVIYTGKASSLRRFKDDVGEVKSGYECGIGLEKFSDIKPGDVIEAFKIEKVVNKELYA